MNPGKKITFILLVIYILSLGIFFGSTDVNRPFIKGMTVSCQTWGYEWATPQMRKAMLELRDIGINWIAIHPYARISEDGHVGMRKNRNLYHITTPLQWGKELKLNFMLKPHLAYWGTKFKWRGNINFDSPKAWQTFFKDYSEWILAMAGIAEQNGAKILCIGTELTHSLTYEKEWQDLIAAIRKIYRGNLTYAANWNNYQQVPFWDDLDYIGIQAYFPLTDSDSPTEDEIRDGWNKVYKKLIPYADTMNKKIIFTEIGYTASTIAAKEPWAYQRSDDNRSRQLQESCLKIALQEVREQNKISGLFLWKWFPETQPFAHYEDFNLQRQEVKELIKRVWE